MTENKIGEAERRGGWILALVILCAGLILYKAMARPSSFDPAYLLGQTGVFALAAWGIFYAVFLRGRGTMRVLATLLAIWMSLFAGAMVSAGRHKHQAVQALSDIHSDLKEYSAASKGVDGSSIPATFAKEGSPTVGGDMGKMQGLIRGQIADFAATQNDYLNTLTAIGWDSILDADRLNADAGLRESLTILAKADENIANTEARFNELFSGLRDRIYALDIPQRDKTAMWKGAQTSMARNRASIDEQFRLEREIVQEVRSIIDLLGRIQWEAQNGQVMLYTDADLATLNSHLEAIDRKSARQQELQAEAMAEMERGFDKSMQDMR